jgi:phosphoribosylcarboxyaminoimidazole (NCAIR) mutase
MTSIGHFSMISETAFNPSIVTLFMTLKGPPFTPADFCRLWKDKHMAEKHPRFHQVVSTTHAGHFEPKKNDRSSYLLLGDTTTPDSMDNDPVQVHVIETLYPRPVREDLLYRIRMLQTEAWNLSDHLWQVYIAPWSSNPLSSPEGLSYLLLKSHHALADGASIASVFMELCDEAEEFAHELHEYVRSRRLQQRAKSMWQRIKSQIQWLVWFVWGSVRAMWYHGTLHLQQWCFRNPWKQLARLHPIDTPDRTVSYIALAPLDQVKWVGNTLCHRGTVNDVMVACVTSAMSRLLDYHRHKLANSSLSEQGGTVSHKKQRSTKLAYSRTMNVAMPVHLQGGVLLPGQSIGNRLGALVVRLPCQPTMDSEQRLQRVHREMTFIKQTPTALLSYLLARGVGVAARVLPASWAAHFFSQAQAGACCVITNVKGPAQTVHLDGRAVESIYGFIPLPPGIPVGVAVNGYAGTVALSVTAEPWAMPDPDLFLSWVLEEYLRLVEVASVKSKNKNKFTTTDA